MRFETKRAIVLTTIMVLGLWPLGHRVLVQLTGWSPWKGFGWAMYCVPERTIRVQANPVFRDGGRWGRAPATLQQMVEDALARYLARRNTMGFWLAPTDYARVLFQAYPKLESVEIVVEQQGLDRETAFIVVERTDHFHYQRP